MSIKRYIARAKILKRKMDRAKTGKEFQKLALERNKALKEAKRLEQLAILKEQEYLAKTKVKKAKERLEAVEAKTKEPKAKGVKGEGKARRAKKALGGIREFIVTREIVAGKPSKRRVAKKKTR